MQLLRKSVPSSRARPVFPVALPAARSFSQIRPRAALSCVTTSAGALFTKFALPSLPCAREIALYALQLFFKTAAFSIDVNQALHGYEQSHVTQQRGGRARWFFAAASDVIDSTRPTRCNKSESVSMRARSSAVAFCNNTGSGLPGEISISPRIWRMPRMNCLTHSISATASASCTSSQLPGRAQHDRVAFHASSRRDLLPDFLGDERHNRMQQPQQRLEHVNQGTRVPRFAHPTRRPTAERVSIIRGTSRRIRAR